MSGAMGAAIGTAMSRPTWGAWIEIPALLHEGERVQVAPHVGRVD